MNSMVVKIPRQETPGFSYHLLRHALEEFGKNLSQLGAEEKYRTREKALESFELETQVITSSEADGLVIPQEQLERSIAEVASRYEAVEDFSSDLAANGLDETGLRHALYRELMFDAVMQRVAARGPDISDIDVRLFYEMNHNRFESPEQRSVSHILMTVNPDFPENTRDAAFERMQQVSAKLAERTNRFTDFAKRYSECPTAMEGGRLGEMSRGQLYPELDAVLFAMEEGAISSIVETEMGFHLLYCEKIKRGKRTPFYKAAPRIREMLQERQRRNCQKAWLNELRRKK